MPEIRYASPVEVKHAEPNPNLGVPGKHYATYYKGLCESDPREALECARRLKAWGYPEHAKHVVERFRKLKNIGPAPSANPPEVKE